MATDIARPNYQTRSVSARPQRLEAVWGSDSLDWKELPAGEIAQRVVSRVCPGSIVLFYNAAIHTPETLPGIIQALLQEGYTFVPAYAGPKRHLDRW